MNFYDRTSRMDFGTFDAYYAELDVGSDEIDCRDIIPYVEGYTYLSCAHVVVEAWLEVQDLIATPLQIDTPKSLGYWVTTVGTYLDSQLNVTPLWSHT